MRRYHLHDSGAVRPSLSDRQDRRGIAPAATGPLPDAAPEPSPEQPAYVLFTSGSTGTPKPVVVPHCAAAAYLDALIERLGLEPGLCYGLASTFAADLGMTAILPALAHGGRLVIVPAATARDPDAFAALMRASRVDLLKIVPGHLEGLLAAARPQDLLPRGFLVLGGEAARPHLLETLAALGPACRVVNHYGPTEATVGVMTGEWDRNAPAIPFDRPLAGARIVLLDETGHRVADGEFGEVHIGGPGLALGYLGQPEATADRFIDHPLAGRLYRTGDLARITADGTLELRGRIDDQVKIRGYRVEPAEMAARIAGSPVGRCGRRGSGRSTRCAAVCPRRLRGAAAGRDARRRRIATLPRRAPARPHAPGRDHVPYRLADRAQRQAQPRRAARTQVRPSNGSRRRRPEVPAATGLGGEDWSWYGGRFSTMRGSAGTTASSISAGIRSSACRWSHGCIAPGTTSTPATYTGILDDRRAGDRCCARVGGGTAEQGRLTGPVPLLLPSQHRFFALVGGPAAHFNLSVLLELEPWVTPELAERAITFLAEHHDGLRLTIAGDTARIGAEGGIVAFSPIARRRGSTRRPSSARFRPRSTRRTGRLIGAAFAEGRRRGCC